MRKAWVALQLAVLMTPLMAVEAAAGSHQSTGMVMSVNSVEGTVVLMENGHRLHVVLQHDTRLLDVYGEPIQALRVLQVGDYIREECDARKGGPFLARKISLLRPAWRMLESPEY